MMRASISIGRVVRKDEHAIINAVLYKQKGSTADADGGSKANYLRRGYYIFVGETKFKK